MPSPGIRTSSRRSALARRGFFLGWIAASLASLSACNPLAVTTIPKGWHPGVSYSVTKSLVEISAPSVASGAEGTATLRLRDANGAPFESTLPVVSFWASGGASTVTFGAVTHRGAGVYTAPFTGGSAGSATTIGARVDGKDVLGAAPTLTVTAGSHSLSQSVLSVSAASVAAGSTVTVTLTVKDALGNTLSGGGLAVAFSHSGGTSTGTFGAVTDHLNGTYSALFTAATPGSATSIHAAIGGQAVTGAAPTVLVTGGGTPAAIAVSSGNGQSGQVGAALSPFVVLVTDAFGQPVAGATVAWAIVSGGGSLSSASGSTDASGLASSTLTLGTVAGASSVTASVQGYALSATFSSTQTPGAFAQLVFSGVPSSAVAGTPFGFTLTAQDAHGNTRTDFAGTVHFASSDGNSPALPADYAYVAGDAGTRQFAATLKTSGNQTLSASVTPGGTPATTTGAIAVSAGAATQLTFITGPSSAASDQAIPAMLVRALDAHANTATSYSGTVTLAIGANPGGGALSGTASVAASSGSASFPGLSIDKAATGYTLTASGTGGVAGATSDPFEISVGAAASIAISSGDGQSATVGTAVPSPLVAVVRDAHGNVVAGAGVTWAVTAGGGSLSSCTTTTDASGLVQCSFTTGTAAGTNTATATLGGVGATAAFTATATAGSISTATSTLAIASGALTSGTATTLTITLKDADGNQVPDATQAANLAITVLGTGTSSGTVGAISAVGGQDGVYTAAFTPTTAGTANTIKASLSGTDFGTSHPSFTVGVGAAAQLAFVQQPSGASTDASISPAVTVVVKDAAGNTVTDYSGNVSVGLQAAANAHGATLSGTTTRAPSSGVVTFNDLALNRNGTGYRLTASSGTLPDVDSGTFDISAIATPYHWTFASGSDYTRSDDSFLQFTGGACELTPVDQTDDSGGAGGFGDSGASLSGVAYTTLQGGGSGVALGVGSSCDGSAGNCANAVAKEIYGLNASWTPQWSSLQGYWRFDGNLDDASGNARAMTASSAAGYSTTAKVGTRAASFVADDDVGELLTVTQGAGLNEGSALSIAFWMKGKPTSDAFARILKKTTEASGAGGWSVTRNNASNGLIFRVDSDAPGGNAQDLTSSSTSYFDDTYHHVVLTANNGAFKFYLDGRLDKNDSYLPGSGFGNTENLEIGSRGTTREYDGLLDELAIWNTVLKPEEIAEIYSHQSVKYAGVLTSRLMDAGSSASWSTFSWVPTLPFLKPLPDSSCSPTPCAHDAGESNASSGYASLVGSDGTTATNDLTTGLIGLWHLNGTAGTIADGAALADVSGQANHASAFDGDASNTISHASGKFGQGVKFDGVNDLLTVTNATSLNLTTDSSMTISGWVHLNGYVTGCRSVLMSKRLGANGFVFSVAGTSSTCAPEGNQSANAGKLGFMEAGGVAGTPIGSTALVPGRWYHVAAVVSGLNVTLYVNGEPDGTGTVSTWKAPNTFLQIGAYYNSGNPIYPVNGILDEMALWNRALHANEIKQLYQRGGSRIKYQVRTCASKPCDETTETWKGPDGTSATYFSEINNNTAPLDATGRTQATLPSFTLASFTSPPASNRYFQYRAILESDSSDVALGPELKSVSVDPIHYASTAPSVHGNDGIAFFDLDTFTPTLGTCSGGVTYALSLDKAAWYWWDSSKAADCVAAGSGAWCLAGGTSATSSSGADMQAHIATFGSAVGRGTVYVKAFLHSDGTSPCAINNLFINGTR